jgi:tRNA dimethylallyltransferase
VSDLHTLHRQTRKDPLRYRASYLLVDPGAALGKRIESRVDSMLAAGWGTEVEMLARKVPADAPAWKASGYSVLKRVALGEIDLSTARERVIIETRQYAKRQRTWFRHQLPPDSVTRVNPDDPASRSIVHDWWESAE